MMPTRFRLLPALLCFAFVALIACGGGDAEVADTPTATRNPSSTATPRAANSTATPTLEPTSTSATPTVSTPPPMSTPTPTPVPVPTSSPTPAPTPTPVLGVELVVNGSFEDGVSDAEGWNFFVPGDGRNIQWVTEGAHTGLRAIKITTVNIERPNPQIDSAALLVLEKGKRYLLSAYVRTDQQASFSFGMSWYQDDGVTRAGAQRKPFDKFVSTEWTQIFFTSDTSTFSLYKDASIGHISLNTHNQAGVAPPDVKELTLYIDDISFRAIIE